MNLWVDFDLKLDPILLGKMAKISPIIHKIEICPKVINSQNKSHRDHIWGMFEL